MLYNKLKRITNTKVCKISRHNSTNMGKRTEIKLTSSSKRNNTQHDQRKHAVALEIFIKVKASASLFSVLAITPAF